MKSFGLAVLAAIGGYVIGLFGGMFFIQIFSTNRHDKSLEAAMTGAFVLGPLMAIVAVIVVWIFRSRQARSVEGHLRSARCHASYDRHPPAVDRCPVRSDP